MNEISDPGSFRHLAASDKRSDASQLWTTDVSRIPFDQAQSPHEAEPRLSVRAHGTANVLRTLVQHRARARHLALYWPRSCANPLGNDDGTAARTRRAHSGYVSPRTCAHRPRSADRHMDELGDRVPGDDWEAHDEQAVWDELDG